ncbi:PDZ domain-containing protein [Chitinophaga lutea]|nr:PDZ domain-containing protein [Chitinophaga lutea]
MTTKNLLRRKCLGALVMLLLAQQSLRAQTVLYVSPTGNDQQKGTLQQPYRTLQQAVNKAAAQQGTQVQIQLRGGTYYPDSAVLIQAGAFRSLTIAPYKGESVTLSGARPVQPQWEAYKNGIWQAKLPLDVAPDRLFINGKPMHMARYPNYDSSARILNGTAADALSEAKVKGWQHPAGGYVHALHAGEWGGMHFRITGKKGDDQLEMAGGWQNNRPSAPHKKSRFVENIFEELDAPGEWYYDSSRQVLYVYPPAGVSLQAAKIAVAGLEQLLMLKGTKQKPLQHVTISGIRFEHTARTFMRTDEPLLRSDWAIFRGGAILCEYTEDVTIRQCVFTGLGGNAVFFSNYNRHGSVKDNHIFNIGASAVAFVGAPEAVRSPAFRYEKFVPWNEMDYTPGPANDNYPAECSAEGNLVHHIGETEKQSAGVQIEMASDITVSHNTIYNVPRAGINIGDGCWGGHMISHNDVFNTVLETGDHGAFNSWGRDRFWRPERRIIDSIVAARPSIKFLDAMKPTVIRNNRFACDHGWDIDLDDGSGNYIIENNVCLSGGLKLREGYGRVVRNNILVNNTFHPHVWLANSGDIFTRNVVTLPYAPIGMEHWGTRIDSNYFLSAAALEAAKALGGDAHSISGAPGFINAAGGDYRFTSSAPALQLGIRSVDDHFGVTSPALKKIAKKAPVPTLLVKAMEVAGERKEWLGATLKNIETLGERSAAGLPDQSGVLVLAVAPGSPMAASGLQKGDVIRKLGDNAIATVTDLLQAYQQHRWMGRSSAVIIRNQAEQKISLLLKTAD